MFPRRPVDRYWSADETEWASDVMFKDHATLAALYLRRRRGPAWRSGPVLAALLGLEAVYLVAAREHYTADVVLAALLAFLLHRAYGRAP